MATVEQNRSRRSQDLRKEIDALKLRIRIFEDIRILVTNTLIPEVEKTMRVVERQELYIKESFSHDFENAKTYLGFIKTSAEVEKQLAADKIREKEKELLNLGSQR